MRFRFTGDYTNGHTSINACGVVFEGREPSNVRDFAAIERLRGHVEFEAVEDEPYEVVFEEQEIVTMTPAPKRRGRKPKAAQ